MSWHRLAASAAVILVLAAAIAYAAEDPAPSALDTYDYVPSAENLSGSELLLFQEIPEVITAAKELQPIT
jgi:predicted outer membrane protein